MNFRTQIPITSTTLSNRSQINHKSKILLFGSCFTKNIGEKLNYFKFQNIINPFGILFHPKAIENSITNAINEKEYTKNDVFLHNERWHCFDAHSELSNSSKEELLLNLNSAVKLTNQQIFKSTHIIITLGTAWIYRFINNDKIVANCHKIPQKKILKEILSVDEIITSLESIISLVKSINPKVKIIFTVSPVRHLKDGFIENTQSKAHLLTAIHQVVEPRNHTHYFPSYEIMLDDLRDYRFYKRDMIHPNETAIEYIWQQFQNTWIDTNSYNLMNEIDTIQKGLSHRPFNENSTQHQEFLENLQLKINKIQEQYQITF
ncbi:MAG: GSCFA domain-containing protein [Flavobacteriaceae bacterium]|nr:GSCFA domain-containing protein [Flavobacteriaceae bacterium]